MKLSACIVIHNEEKYLPRCLESIKDFVSEIILIHDGKCSDRSLEIARKYKAKIFIRGFIGEAEYHRPFTYDKAEGEWILQIDADEFINQQSWKDIKNIIRSTNIDAACFWWPYSNNNTYIRKGPFSKTFKPCLFRKNKMFMIGISHEYPRTYGNMQKYKNIHLEHLFDYDKYSEEVFKDKWTKWAKIQAKQILNIENSPKYNISNLADIKVFKEYDFMRKHPVVSGLIETTKKMYIYIKRGILCSGLMSIKIAWFELRYLWLVRKYLIDLRYGRKL